MVISNAKFHPEKFLTILYSLIDGSLYLIYQQVIFTWKFLLINTASLIIVFSIKGRRQIELLIRVKSYIFQGGGILMFQGECSFLGSPFLNSSLNTKKMFKSPAN